MFCRRQPLYLSQKVGNMAKVNQIRRLGIIINKLRHVDCIPAPELIEYVKRVMSQQCGEETGYTLRTLQRDFGTIETLFGIEISHRNGGYGIVPNDNLANFHEELLCNFEILNAIDSDSAIQQYVLAEQRRHASSTHIADILDAIRNRLTVEFDYTLFRHNNSVVSKQIEPYYLKESQHRWYLVGYDTDKKLKCFALDRISLFRIAADRPFTRREDIDIPALFRESFGIWNDPQMPVEEIILRYDTLDGEFVKTLPLHESQEIVSDDDCGLVIKVHLRITNDFVMELLSRSRSVEVLKPASLRQRLYDIYVQAIERNTPENHE